MRLKKLADQTIVITGASSGIGLATARLAAARGARLVLAGRSAETLAGIVDGIDRRGGRAIAVTADVGREEDVAAIAEAALRGFDGFDSWVNNAGVSTYGNILDVPIEDQRRLFDTNYWGAVYGCRVAAEHLRTRRRQRYGGAIINVGSVLSDRAIPLQGAYSASKHALKGFTDALRMELEHEGAPVSVTLIKPGAIDTPYPQHAQNYLPVEPQNPSPLYAPELVAEAILHAAEHPVRDLYVGGGAKLIAVMASVAPRLTDRVMELTMFRRQRSRRPAGDRTRSGLYRPAEDGRTRGGTGQLVFERSLYTEAMMSPAPRLAAGVALGTLVAALWARRWRSRDGNDALPTRR